MISQCTLPIITEHANISGWGINFVKTSSRRLAEVRTSESLMVAQVPIVDYENCTERIKQTGVKITENMICAGGAGADACAGDSGGPLTCARNGTSGEEERYLCGIISWGFNCVPRRRLGRSYPGFYTDVSKYTRWIQNFIGIWEKHYWSKTRIFQNFPSTF